MMDKCSLLDFYWTIEYHPFTAIIMLGRRARTFFLYNADCIRLKEEIICTLNGLKVSKSGGNFHSWVNCPFKY